jgi:hypothetical protein
VAARIDVTNLPEVRAIAEQVSRTGQSVELCVDGHPIALLSEASPWRDSEGRSSRAMHPGDSFLGLIGIGAEDIVGDGATDVSTNKYKYIAEAIEKHW